jgi:hypothetical protein
MDRKSIQRFKKLLEARNRELRAGLAQTRQEMRTAPHDHGKVRGFLAEMQFSRKRGVRTIAFPITLVVFGKNFFEPICLPFSKLLIRGCRPMTYQELFAATVTSERAHFLGTQY